MRSCLAVIILTFATFTFASPSTLPTGAVQVFSTEADGNKIRLGDVQLSPDGSKLSLTYWISDPNSSKLLVFDVATKQSLYEATAAGNMRFVRFAGFSPDSSRIAVVTQAEDASNTLSVIELKTRQSVYDFTVPFGMPEVIFTPDGKEILHAETRPKYDPEYRSHFLAVGDIAAHKVVRELKFEEFDRPLGVFSSDGALLVTAGLQIFDRQTSQLVCKLKTEKDSRSITVRFLPDSKRIRSVNQDGVVTTWDARTGNVLTRVEPQFRIDASNIALSDEANRLYLQWYRGLLVIDADTMKPIGIWRHGPTDSSMCKLNTLQHGELIVEIDPHKGGDLLVMRLPDEKSLEPVPALTKMQARIGASSRPSTSPAVPVPAHADKDLRDPRWWLDRASAEVAQNKEQRPGGDFAIQSAMARERARAGDFQGSNEILQNLSARFPATRPSDWLSQFKAEIVAIQVRSLARQGKFDEAKALGDTFPDTRFKIPAGAVDQAIQLALADRLDESAVIVATCDAPLRGRILEQVVTALLAKKEFDQAATITSKVDDPYWKTQCNARLAIAQARAGNAEAALQSWRDGKAFSGSTTAWRMIRAAARNNHDDVAQKIIDALPENERNDAWAALANAQLERNDISAAEQTATNLTGNSAWYFNHALPVSLIQNGQVDRAVELTLARPNDAESYSKVFKALLDWGYLDQARQLMNELAKSPRFEAQSYSLSLATAMADAGRISEAESLSLGYDLSQGPGQMTMIAIARAKRRKGDKEGFQAMRQPFLDALQSASGAPSRLKAQQMLVSFDLATGNIDQLTSEIEQFDPSIGANFMMLILIASDKSTPNRISLDSAQFRDLTRIGLGGSEQGATIFLATVVTKHLAAGEFETLLQWMQTLPTSRARSNGYLMVARELIPKDTPAHDADTD